MLNITLLGCGGGMPMPNRFLSSLLINYRGHKILIDCGEGTQVSMRMVNSGFKNIDVICITHIHGDHIVGLPGLLGTIGNSGRTEKLTIIGPVGITNAVNGLRTIALWLPYEIEIIENPTESIIVLEDIIITTLNCNHSSPCLGYSFYLRRLPEFDVEKAKLNNIPKILWSRLQKEKLIEYDGNIYTNDKVLGDEREGIKLSMITDTRPTKDMINFIRGSDLFVCEGTYALDEDMEKALKNKHMLFREAAELAKRSDVKRLLLTHFSTAMKDPFQYIENASSIFENTIIGYDRYETVLNFI